MGLRGRSKFSEERHFFVTTTVVNYAKVFINDKYCEILIDNIKHYQNRYHFIILCYVIMPSHFHWIIETDAKFGTLSDIMRDIKKYSAWDVMDELEKDGRTNLTRIFRDAAKGISGQKRKFWMQRFDDEVIRNREMFLTKLRYIHNNPVKAGLVENPEDYKYSSARNYMFGDHSVIFVKTEW